MRLISLAHLFKVWFFLRLTLGKQTINIIKKSQAIFDQKTQVREKNNNKVEEIFLLLTLFWDLEVLFTKNI